MPIQLSERLKTVSALVDQGAQVADIGCDHGFVPIYLIKNEIAAKAIAIDVKEGPLERAREHIREYGLEDKIETRLSDGMKGLLPGEADTVIMAGIGGPLMIRIIEESPKTVDSVSSFILSPQSEIEQVRRYLSGSGFQVKEERMVLEEGKYYTVMKTEHGKEGPCRSVDYRYGKKLLEQGDHVLLSYLEKEVETLSALIRELEEIQAGHPRLKELERKRGLALQALGICKNA